MDVCTVCFGKGYVFIHRLRETYCHLLMIGCSIDRTCADIVYHVIVDALGCFALRVDQLYCDPKKKSNQSMVILLVLTGLHCIESCC